MKKIIKMFAVVMAFMLAMAVFTPIASAQAAAKPKLNKSSKTIYVGGSAYKKIKSTYTLKIKNKPSKYSASWSVDNSDIVTIKKLKGGKCRVTANSAGNVGTAVVTCTLKDKSANVVYKLQSTITVKRNSSNVKVTYTGSLDSLKVGDTVKMTGSMIDKSGNTLVTGETTTDIIKWNSSNTDVATVSSTGTVTIKGAGDTTITCYSVQEKSGTYSKLSRAVAKAEVKISVKEDLSVKQTALKTVVVTFGTDMSKQITKTSDVSITNKVNSARMTISAIKFDSTGKQLTITTSSEFPDANTYIFAYGDMTKEFTSSKGAVAKLEIYTESGNRAVVGSTTQLKFRIFDANGVDITPDESTSSSSAYMSHKAHMTYELASTPTNGAYNLVGGDSIGFFMENYTAVVKGTYHSFKYEGSQEVGNIAATVSITSVNEASLISVDGATIIAKATSGDKIDFTKTVNTVAVNDTGYRIVVRAKDANGKYIYSNDATSGLAFNLTTSNVVQVTTDGELLPIQTGTATITVNYAGTAIYSFPVQVVAARTPQSLSFSVDGVAATSAIISSAYGTAGELSDLYIKVTATDQYGNEMEIPAAASLIVEPQTNVYTSPVATVTKEADGSVYIHLNGAGAGSTSGMQYPYKITYDKVISGFTVIVRDPVASAASTYKIVLTGDTSLTVPNAAGVLPYINIDVFEQKNGVNYSKVSTVYSDAVYSVNSMSSGMIYYSLLKNGSRITDTGFVTNGRINTVKATGANVLTKMETGSYTIVVYEKLVTGGSRQLANSTFSLTDTATEVVVERTKTNTSLAITANMSTAQMINVLLDCYSITIGDTRVTNGWSITFNDATVRSNVMVVRTIDVQQPVVVGNTTYLITHRISINGSITTS